ncbi:MAG: FAD-dependent oxidoreductase [Candidatus Omnitrophota bacterium]|jgi:NAD(P)H-nitrite reductase large subunit
MNNLVIIGNSAAGISAAEAIRAKDKDSKIIIISDEDYNSYCRCLISYYLAGEITEDKLVYRPESFYKENNLNLMLNHKVVKVEPKKNRVIFEDKTSIDYDTLLIATGASAKFPDNLKTVRKRGVFGLRTIQDTKEILSLVPLSSSSCVLGGGLISLKAAYGLLKQKQEIKVIVKSNFVLSQMLDEKGARLFMHKFQNAGVEILTGRDIVEVVGNGDLKAVKLDTGKVIACSILVIGKGVNPNLDIIKDTKIKQDKGILVDEYMKTSIPNIFAAGDVTQTFDIAYKNSAVNALWPNAVEQGRIAGLNMLGDNLKYDGSMTMNSIGFFDLPAISMGITRPKQPEFEELMILDEQRNIYKKFVIRNNRLAGMIAIGDVRNCGVFLRLIKESVDISSIKQELTSQNFNYARVLDLLKPKDEVYIF